MYLFIVYIWYTIFVTFLIIVKAVSDKVLDFCSYDCKKDESGWWETNIKKIFTLL